MPFEIELELVLSRLDVEPLQVAVETVHDADEVAVDVDLRVPWRHLEPRRTTVVVDDRSIVRIGILAIAIAKAVVGVAVGIGIAEPVADPKAPAERAIETAVVGVAVVGVIEGRVVRPSSKAGKGPVVARPAVIRPGRVRSADRGTATPVARPDERGAARPGQQHRWTRPPPRKVARKRALRTKGLWRVTVGLRGSRC